MRCPDCGGKKYRRNMLDREFRELERQWIQGDLGAGARILRERMRMGEIPVDHVRLAATLGDRRSLVLVEPLPLTPWPNTAYLADLPDELMVSFAADIAERSFDIDATPRPVEEQRAIRAIRNWASARSRYRALTNQDRWSVWPPQAVIIQLRTASHSVQTVAPLNRGTTLPRAVYYATRAAFHVSGPAPRVRAGRPLRRRGGLRRLGRRHAEFMVTSAATEAIIHHVAGHEGINAWMRGQFGPGSSQALTGLPPDVIENILEEIRDTQLPPSEDPDILHSQMIEWVASNYGALPFASRWVAEEEAAWQRQRLIQYLLREVQL